MLMASVYCAVDKAYRGAGLGVEPCKSSLGSHMSDGDYVSLTMS